MIGNDIVDLDDPESLPGATHPRFDERAFSVRERALLARSDEPARLRWVLWAAKEASFKLARSERPDTVFSPPKFEVEMSSHGAAVVRHEGGAAWVELDVQASWVHAIARRSEQRQRVEIASVSQRVGEDPSGAVRALAIKALAPRLDASQDELHIGRRPGGAPLLLRRERPVGASLSFSHHGRFVAFACELVMGPAPRRSR